MSFLAEVILAVSYSIIAVLAWTVFTSWLHDTKRGFSESWTLSAVVGLALACVWPISLTMLVFYENGATSCWNNDKG